MKQDHIVEVGIDQDARLFVRPEQGAYEYIYRTAAEVRWNASTGVLHTLAPRDMSYLNWFRQIWLAVAGEYGVDLAITDRTRWSAIPDDLRLEIESDQPWRESQPSRMADANKSAQAEFERSMVLSRAQTAFVTGRYREAIELFAKIDKLTPLEQKKLDLARKRLKE